MADWQVGSFGATLADTDRYEAFPDAVRVPATGRIVATWSSSDDHYGAGTGNIRWSDDGGATWSARQNAPTAAALAARGSTVALLNISTETGTRTAWLYKSVDGGVTWGPRIQITAWGANGWIFPSGLAWHDDGTPNGLLMATSYGPDGVLVVTSANAGATWVKAGVAKKGSVWQDATESTTLRLPSGEIVMLIRNDSRVTIEMLRSTDKGVTWSKPVTVLERASGLPRMTMMPDGAILATLRGMGFPAEFWATGLSRDGGRSWTLERISDEWMMYGRFVAVDADSAVLVGGSGSRTDSGHAWVWRRHVELVSPPERPPVADPPRGTGLQEGEWELDGVKFGDGFSGHPGPYHIMREGDATAGMVVRHQDVTSPREDGIRFGRDYLTPPERAFIIRVDNSDNRALAELRALWRGDAARSKPGGVSVLRWRLHGVTYRAYGRARDFEVVRQDYLRPDRVIVHASFQYRDTHAWADDQSQVSLTINSPILGTGLVLPAVLPWTLGDAPSERAGSVTVAATAPAPFTATIIGPVYGSATQIRLWGEGWLLDFGSLALLPGQRIVVDTAAGTARLGGASIAGKLTATSTLRARLAPGSNSFRFAAADPSASTSAAISWRDPVSIF